MVLCMSVKNICLMESDYCFMVLQALVFMIFGGSQVANHNLGLF
jgi:hypothetical protein